MGCLSCFLGVPRCSCDMRLIDRPRQSDPEFVVVKVDPDCRFHELLAALLGKGKNKQAATLADHEANHLIDDYLMQRRREAEQRRRDAAERAARERERRFERALGNGLTYRPFEALAQKGK
jgi:hypothetical protein